MSEPTPIVKDRTVFDSGGKTIIAFSPEDSNRLIAANKNGITKILQLDRLEQEPEVLQISENLTSLSALSHERFIISTSKGDAFEYNYKTSNETLLLRTSLPLRDCSIIHNGKTAIFASDDLELNSIDIAQDNSSSDPSKRSKLSQILTLPDQISQLSYSPKINILAITLINGDVLFYSLSSSQPNKVHQLDKCAIANSYPSNSKITSEGEKTSNTSKLDALLDDDISDLSDDDDDNDETEKITDPEFVEANRVSTRIAWHPTGMWFAVPDRTGSVKVYTLKNYALVDTLPPMSSKKLIDLQFDTANGEYIAAVDTDNKLTVWKWKTGEVHYTRQFKRVQLTNLLWKTNGDSLDIIMGSWIGSVTTVSNVAKVLSNKTSTLGEDEDVPTKSTRNGLFVDSDDEDDNVNPNIDTMAEDDNGNVDEGLENNNDDGDDGDLFGEGTGSGKRKYHFEDEEEFIDDDDNGGYIERNTSNFHKTKAHKSTNVSNVLSLNLQRFKYKPMSPGATPFAGSDRRYLTMNNIGYVSTVRNNGQYSITVSFFDLGRYNEYHFEDLFGYDLCFLNEHGTLFGQSKSGQLHYRPHDTLHSTWTKLISLADGEILTSIAATTHKVVVGSSFGNCTSLNEYGLILSIEKLSPIVLITAYEYRVFIIHYSPFHGISYSLFEQSPTKSIYYQREIPLPITLPQTLSGKNRNADLDYEQFNPTGIKSLFFSLYGDPCVFGADNVLLVLSKWRSNMESRWLPILDTDMEIWKMAGGKENSDVHVWPLGLTYNTLNCVLVKGKKQWPEFPLPLPSEMEVRVPVLVKSKLLQEHKLKLQKEADEREFDRELDDADADDEKETEKEIEVPVNVAAEEEYIRSKVLSSLLTDTIENDGEMYGNENDLLQTLIGTFDKSLLRLFAVACSGQDAEKAFSIVQELKQDRALTAAAKISERAEMMTLMKRINDLRETRFEQQINNI